MIRLTTFDDIVNVFLARCPFLHLKFLPKGRFWIGFCPTVLYLVSERQANSIPRYVLEQTVMGMLGWIPTVAGIALRSLFYRLILQSQGPAAIERDVRLRFASNIRLGHGVYLDEGVYIHACPEGVEIGPNTLVMHGSVLHVYNFRGLPHAASRSDATAWSVNIL
jgi:hypothetical protein